ncbi:MAG TPA: PilZ domain-containing protein [Terriglobales bacterium]|jgi:TonB family protein
MTTFGRTPFPANPHQRRVPRCPLAVPVRVTVRKATGTQGIPGRSLDLSEGGIAAVIAGELQPGDPVGIEFLLPELGLGLQTSAVVRYHAALRSGLEFQSLSLEQQAMIRRWTRRVMEAQAQGKAQPSVAPVTEAPAEKHPAAAVHKPAPRKSWRASVLMMGLAGMLVLAVVFWARWRAAWSELDRQTAAYHASKAQRIELPPGIMDQFVQHRADAQNPEGGNAPAGTALLNVVIGTDGTVIDQHPVKGSEGLTRAAMEAVKDWRFEPFKLGGRPVEVQTTMAVQVGP